MIKAEADHIFTEELYALPEKVLVLIPTPWQTLTADQVQLLSKILSSVKLRLEGVQIIHQPEIHLNSLRDLKYKTILSFGTQTSPPVKPFSSDTIQGIQIIQSDALNELDDVKKKTLWGVLKQAFKL